MGFRWLVTWSKGVGLARSGSVMVEQDQGERIRLERFERLGTAFEGRYLVPERFQRRLEQAADILAYVAEGVLPAA